MSLRARLKRFFPALFIILMLLLVGETQANQTQTGPSMDQVVSLIAYMFPTLILLAVLSMLFGFLKNIDRAWGK